MLIVFDRMEQQKDTSILQKAQEVLTCALKLGFCSTDFTKQDFLQRFLQVCESLLQRCYNNGVSSQQDTEIFSLTLEMLRSVKLTHMDFCVAIPSIQFIDKLCNLWKQLTAVCLARQEFNNP